MIKHTKKELRLFKILDILGALFLAIAIINNFFDGVDHAPFTSSILYPHTNFIVPAVNIFCFVMAIVYLLFPSQIWIIFALFMIEAVHLMSTGFETVGIIIYINFFAILSASGYAKRHFKIKASIFGGILILLLSNIIYSSGFYDFFYYLAMAIFMISCYTILYYMLYDKLNFLFKEIAVPDLKSSLKLPEKGSNLNLKNFGLTQRQISCIHYTLNTSFSYKMIAEKLVTSESTVKKDMQDLYKFFGVKNREMLRLLLLQYKIV
ncbi:helix-turn-helix transcriptional regulator [Treponema pectinovorum]|uniref:helix-turn-helix transcriptional regulator n=1 Tax=Treponema pectinovorum TaxID=164 RepID=UPI0011CADC45|nr:hypothetical protein [Treponema pectinovorum]